MCDGDRQQVLTGAATGGQGGAGPLKLGGGVAGMGLCQAEGKLSQPCEGNMDRGGLDSLCCLPGEKGWVGMGWVPLRGGVGASP